MKRLLLLGLLVIAGCAASQVRAGDRDARKGRWEEALVHYQEAARRKPEDKRIAQRLERARGEVSNLYVARARRASNAGRLVDAMALYGTALEYDAGNTNAGNGARGVASQLMALGDTAWKHQDLETAAVSYRAIHRVLPDYPDVAAKWESSSKAFAAQLIARARTELNGDWCGNALVLAARSLSYVPGRSDGQQLVTNARSCLMARNQVFMVSAPPQREWLTEQVMGGLFGAHSPFAGPRAPDPKLETTVYVELLNLEEFEEVDEDRRTKKVKVASGRNNPRIDELTDLIDRLEDEVRELAEEYDAVKDSKFQAKNRPSTQIKEDLEDKTKELEEAKEELDDASEYTTEELDVVYVVREVKRISKARFLVRLEDPVIGLWDQQVTVAVEAGDTHIPPVPHAEIEGDPLVLPTYEEMGQELAERSVEAVSDVLTQGREARRAALIERGRELERKNDERSALEAYADALFLPPARADHHAGSVLGSHAEMEPGSLLP